MESAIPEGLKCPRTTSRRISDDYTPPYPARVARADAEVHRVTMAYFGVQPQGPALHGKACAALLRITTLFALANGPQHHDLAHFVDADGYDTMMAIAYWTDPQRYRRW